jgi:hypothetical protein
MRAGFYAEMLNYPTFAARLRINTGHMSPSSQYLKLTPELGGETNWRIINHSAWKQIPFEKYGKSHPEYYALIDGKRPSPDNTEINLDICRSNPEVARVVARAVLEELREDLEARNVAVSMNDTHQQCQCPGCQKLVKQLGTGSGPMIGFVNAVAREVRKTRPDVLIGTLGYFHNRQPPKKIKPEPNVQVMFCSYESCRLHAIDDPNCPANAATCRDLEKWEKISSNLLVWCYITNWGYSQLPVPNFNTYETTFRYYAAHHVKGIFVQSMHHTVGTEFSDLKNYLTCNLLWDPSRSSQKLRDEFLDLHYVSAAPPIRQWMAQMESHIRANKIHQGQDNSAGSYGIDESIAQAGLKAFAQAMKLADNETVRLRVEKLSICAYCAALDPVMTLKDGDTPNTRMAAQMRPLAKTFFDLCRKHSVLYTGEGAKIELLHDRLSKLLGL